MFVFVVFLGFVTTGIGWYAMTHPGSAGSAVEWVSGQLRAARAGAQEQARAQAVTPKSIGDLVVRKVIKSAIEMPNGTRLAKTNVHVYLAEEVVAELGAQVLAAIRDQVLTLIDAEINRKGWSTAGTTSVQIQARSGLGRTDIDIEMAMGTDTVLSRPMRNDAGPTNEPVAGARPGLEIAGSDRRLLPEFGDVIVGRDPSCTINLDTEDTRVSRRHFKLVMSPRGPLLTDTSSNGTWVDGKQVEGSVVLRDGAVIGLAGHDRNTIVYRKALGAEARR
jgi:hypothetical protein